MSSNNAAGVMAKPWSNGSRKGLIAAVLLGTVTIAQATVFAVNDTIDVADATLGDGACATAALTCTLRAAFQEALALPGDDSLLVPAGTYTLTIAGRNENASATGDLDIRDGLIVQGAGPALTIIDAGALDRVLDIDNPGATPLAVTITGLTVRNGLLDAGVTDGSSLGAGMRVRGDTLLTLADVDVRDNVGDWFGGAAGIDNQGCIHGTRVRVVGNKDPSANGSRRVIAGGIFQSNNAADSGCLMLDDAEIGDNDGDQSGALYTTGGAPVTFRRVLIHDNTARFTGAILLNSGNDILLENVTMANNRGNSGATLNDGGSTLTLRNATVAGNRGVEGNGPPVVGGLGDVHGSFGRTFLSNTVLDDNGPGSFADDCDRGRSVGGGHNLIGSTDCLFEAQASDRIGVDAGLAAIADNGGFTRTLLPGPAAIDQGSNVDCLPTDQRGLVRPQDGDADGETRCDIGAVEMATPVLFADGFE